MSLLSEVNTDIRKISKQQSYYNKNKERINKNRRKKYRANKENLNKNRVKNLKPNDIKNSFFSSKIGELNQLFITLTQDDNRTEQKNKLIMSLNDLLTFSKIYLVKGREDRLHTAPKTTRFLVLPEIVFYVGHFRIASFTDLEHYLRNRVSKRQLKRNMQLLVKLKWIVPFGRGGALTYRANPFLEALRDLDETYLLLGEYARLQIDFFDLLNLPLLNAVKSIEKIVNAKVEFHKFEMGSHAQWVRAFFEGLVSITLTFENGNIFESCLPVNKHASSKIVGYDNETKKRITNPYGFYHHTIPLKWELFDIVESAEFTKKGRKTRWAKELGEYTYIHFDNSFKIIQYNKNTLYGNVQYLTFREPFEKLLDKTWSKKDVSCQYVEVSDFDTLQRLFTYRFVDGKRRIDLFDALEIKTKKIHPYT